MILGSWDSPAALQVFKGAACYRFDLRLGALVLSAAWWRKSWRNRQVD